jgi:hypothetical protein
MWLYFVSKVIVKGPLAELVRCLDRTRVRLSMGAIFRLKLKKSSHLSHNKNKAKA